MDAKTPSRSVIVAFFLTVFFGGDSPIAIRYIYAELPPFFSAAVRLALAGSIFFLMMLIFRLPLPRGRELMGAILFGLIGSGFRFALLYWALETLRPAMSMIILALVPLMTFLLACLHKQEKFRWKALIGSLIALGGIGVVFWNQLSADAPFLPMLAVVGAAACCAESNIIIKAYPHSHPITTNAIGVTTGAVLLFILSALMKETPRWPSLPATWGALAFLTLFGSVAVFALTIYVIKNWTASASAYMFVLFPFITMAMSAWLARESISLTLSLGAVLVLAGVYTGAIANNIRLPSFRLSLPRKQEPCLDCAPE